MHFPLFKEFYIHSFYSFMVQIYELSSAKQKNLFFFCRIMLLCHVVEKRSSVLSRTCLSCLLRASQFVGARRRFQQDGSRSFDNTKVLILRLITIDRIKIFRQKGCFLTSVCTFRLSFFTIFVHSNIFIYRDRPTIVCKSCKLHRTIFIVTTRPCTSEACTSMRR